MNKISPKSRIFLLLKWIEKYAKTDMIYATRSSFWLMSNQTFAAGVSFLLTVIFAYFLPKETFGIYKYILSMAGLASAFSLTGINSAVMRAVAQGRDDFYKKSFSIQAKWSFIQFFFAFALGGYYVSQSNLTYAICFFLISIFGPLASISNTYNAFLVGKKDFRSSAIYGLVSTTSYLVTMSAISIWVPMVVYLIAGYYISNTLVNALFCWKTLKKISSQRSSEQTVQEDTSYAKNLSLMNVFSSAAQNIDNIVVYHFLGATQLAIYSFANVFPDRIRLMFGVISTAAFPKFAEKDSSPQSNHELRASILRKMLVLIVLAIFIIALYIIFAPYVFQIFFPQYLGSILYSQVLAISILTIAANIPVPALFAQRKQKELLTISVGLPIIKILISIVAIIYFGIWGAIFSKLLQHVLYVGISGFLTTRRTG